MKWLPRIHWSKEDRVALLVGVIVLFAMGLVFLGWIILSFLDRAANNPLWVFGEAYVWASTKSDQESFVFWGQVLNGQGQPVEGAVVNISSQVMGEWEEHSRASDDQGFFSFEDYGTGIRVIDIEGPGIFFYDRNPAEELSNVHNASTWGFKFRRGGYNMTYLADESNPAIFVLVKTGEPIAVWPSRGGSDLNGGTGQIYSNAPLRPLSPSVEIIDTTNGPIAGEPIPRWAPYNK